MSITFPTFKLEKTWYCRANIPFDDTSSATGIANSWIHILKVCLTGEIETMGSGTVGPEGARPSSSFWTFEQGCNGVATGIDPFKTPLTSSDYVRATSGSAHTWCLLRPPAALGETGYLIFDLVTTNELQWGLIFSKNDFLLNVLPIPPNPLKTIGGSVGGRPSSFTFYTSEMCAGTNTEPQRNGSAVMITDTSLLSNHYAHFCCDNSGSFIFAVSRLGTGVFTAFLTLGKAVDGETGDQNKWFWGMHNQGPSGRGAPAYAQFYGQGGISGRYSSDAVVMSNGGACPMQFGGSVFALGASGFKGDILTGKYHPWPIYLMSLATADISFRGRVQDIWGIGPIPVGSMYPTTGSFTHIVAGDVIFPFSVVPFL